MTTEPTAREIRELNEPDHLLALLDGEVREKVLSGEYYAVPGRKPDRPWVRRADNHRVVQGQAPNTPDPAETGRRTAVKQTASYRNALELFLPLFKEDGQKQSFEGLIEKFVWAIEGYPTAVKFDCPHPESCTLKGRDGQLKQHVVQFVDKPNAEMMFKLIELLSGKAAQTVNTNIRAEADIRILEHRTQEVVVYDMSTQTAEQRKQRLIDAGVIEAEWTSRVLPTDFDAGLQETNASD